jgi:RNA polymerase sigma factor (sigma-70 family)
MVTDGTAAPEDTTDAGTAGGTGRRQAGPQDVTVVPSVPGPSGPSAAERDGEQQPQAQVAPRHELADRAAALFRSWCEGDDPAGGQLVRTVTPVLWHTARAYRLDGSTAEDVVQNAWLALARRRDQIRDPQAVLAWLLVTVRRDAARTAATARAASADPEALLLASPDPSPGPAATVVDDDRARRLWQAVARLSERCQRLLRVIAFSDRPDYASLSVDLGMPLGSIGPTRGRCLKKLREHLGAEELWTA